MQIRSIVNNSQRAVLVVNKKHCHKRQVCLTLLAKEAIFLIVVLLVKTAKDQRRLLQKSQTGAFMQGRTTSLLINLELQYILLYQSIKMHCAVRSTAALHLYQ